MRHPVNVDRLEQFMSEAGHIHSPASVYFTGGATALLHGWRESTIDIDIHVEADHDALLREIPRIKEELEINVELAAPHQFIPPLPGWRDRSASIRTCGPVSFFHYDYYAQALSKLERAHDRDLEDVRQMLARELIKPAETLRCLEEVLPEMFRYPAINANAYERRVREFLRGEG